ncbi:MAG: hypothetical protein M1531_06785 [Chloroflexi bacterium]|nr:hypothetical protein [Chloroflexota bacterium]
MAEKPSEAEPKCQCPYCEEELQAVLAPFCSACGARIVYCQVCHVPVDKESGVCPECGRPAR